MCFLFSRWKENFFDNFPREKKEKEMWFELLRMKRKKKMRKNNFFSSFEPRILCWDVFFSLLFYISVFCRWKGEKKHEKISSHRIDFLLMMILLLFLLTTRPKQLFEVEILQQGNIKKGSLNAKMFIVDLNVNFSPHFYSCQCRHLVRCPNRTSKLVLTQINIMSLSDFWRENRKKYYWRL